MLTGVRPFAHDDVAETLAAILMREPDWRALPASVPPNVRRVLTGCLEKNSHERLRDIGDVRLELRRSDRPVVARASSGVRGPRGFSPQQLLRSPLWLLRPQSSRGGAPHPMTW